MSALSTFPKAAGDQLTAAEVEKIRKQRVLVMTAGEAITVGQPVYFKTSDSKVYKASGNAAGEAAYNFIGFALQTASTNDTFEVGMSYSPDQSGLTAGLNYYLQSTAGAVGTPVGTAVVFVGRAISATELVRDYEMRLMTASISDNNAVATSTGGGTNTDTTVTHNLGVIPKSIRISATVTAGGSTNSAIVLGEVEYDSAGNVILANWQGWDGSGTLSRSQWLRSSNSNMVAVGIGGIHDTITLSIISITATTFVFRINAVNTSGTTAISAVNQIRWVATA